MTTLAKAEVRNITGAQRLRNIKTKVNIEAQRNLRAFLAGRLDILECTGDLLDQFIAAEFDRLSPPHTKDAGDE